MEKLSVRRIGVLVKPNHPEALKTICLLAEWCAARGIALAGGPRLERERIEEETGCTVETLDHAELVCGVDLIVKRWQPVVDNIGKQPERYAADAVDDAAHDGGEP